MFVVPFPVEDGADYKHHVTFFNDGDIEEAVHKHITEENITVYSSYYIRDWEVDYENNFLLSATFESRHRLAKINCLAMFMYNTKIVSMHLCWSIFLSL